MPGSVHRVVAKRAGRERSSDAGGRKERRKKKAPTGGAVGSVAAGRTARAAWAAKETGPDRDGLERGVTLGRARAGRACWLTRQDVLPAEGDAGRWGRRAGASTRGAAHGVSGESGDGPRRHAALAGPTRRERTERTGLGSWAAGKERWAARFGMGRREVGHGPV